MLKGSSVDSIRSEETTIISHDVQIEGKISSSGNIMVDGSVKGDIICQKNVNIGEGGQVNGHVSASNISVGGSITGTVSAREKLTLESKGILNGDVSTKTLVVEAGARFNGNAKMGNSQNYFENKKTNSKDVPLVLEPGNSAK